jgi:hypothetical protein
MMQAAAGLVAERGAVYGTIRNTHQKIANLSMLLTGVPLTAHDILMIMVAVKLSRIAQTPNHLDSYLDALNYLSFAGEIATDAVEQG